MRGQARLAYRSVLIVSSQLLAAGLTAASMTVLELPPSEACSSARDSLAGARLWGNPSAGHLLHVASGQVLAGCQVYVRPATHVQSGQWHLCRQARCMLQLPSVCPVQGGCRRKLHETRGQHSAARPSAAGSTHLKKLGQLAVPVGYVAPLTICQRVNDLAQGRQGQVDSRRLPQPVTLALRLRAHERLNAGRSPSGQPAGG